MTDTLSPKERSKRMSLVRNKDTKPELLVRRLIHGMGYRYRLHRPDLPGKPDLAFPSRKKVIFVHGCFWHRHKNCKLARLPKSNIAFWKEKLEANKSRDRCNVEALHALGWHELTIWECQLKDTKSVQQLVRNFLGTSKGKKDAVG